MFKGKIDLSMLSSIDYEEYISLKDCLKYRSLTRYNIPICLGRDENGEILIKDMVDLQNLLLCGVTGTGKSVFIHSFINTILLSKTSKDVKFIMIDPKIGVEMLGYNGISHLLHPVITDPDEAYEVFSWCLEEIERRKESNIKRPSIVIVIDEFADVMLADQNKAIRLETIVRNGNEVGIYTLLSTSSPSERVVTETLQEYIYARMAGMLATAEDSERVIVEGGAENLSGNGDMIFKNKNTGEMIRVQAPYISTEEQDRVLEMFSKNNENKHIKIQNEEEKIDPLFEDAKRLVVEKKQASPTFLQKHLKIGYNHAARLIEQLEKAEVITSEEKNRKRRILLDKYEHPIDEVIKEVDAKNKQEKHKPTGDILWLTKKQVKNALNMDKELPIKEIKGLPFLQEDIHCTDLSPFALVAGILKIYDIENSEMVESVYGIDVSKQRSWYREFLLTIGQEEPKEEFTEELILGVLVRIRSQYGNDFALPLYKNAMSLFPTSKIFCDYTTAMIDFLYDHPEERNKGIYKELQKIFMKIKKEEVDARIWESMVLTNYCLTDLLGGDKSKAPYLDDIKQENKVKAMKERSCFDILFGEEYI